MTISDDEGAPPGQPGTSEARGERESSVVPSGRVSRFLSLGATATRMAAGGLTEKARRLTQKASEAQLPHVALTAKNAALLARKLSRLRGAAMKVGQMLSLEGDNMLPPEFAAALEVLRSSAHQMPERQVREVLRAELGADYETRFSFLSITPLAAASIGQVHAARHQDGRDLVLKIQYPGVAESVDSDVDNLRALLSLARLLPGEINVDDMTRELKAELHREVDYAQELISLTKYRAALGQVPGMRAPKAVAEHSTKRVLCLERAAGTELLKWSAGAPAHKRDRVAGLLIELLLREFFVMGISQTDPNPANYFYDSETDELVLLDFGATRVVPSHVSALYKKAFLGIATGNRVLLEDVVVELGFASQSSAARSLIVDLGLLAAPVFEDGVFDFRASTLGEKLKERGREMVKYQKELSTPPAEYIFFQRKLAGTFLLCRQLGGRVNCREILRKFDAGLV